MVMPLALHTANLTYISLSPEFIKEGSVLYMTETPIQKCF